jgi:hypothetical protein
MLNLKESMNMLKGLPVAEWKVAFSEDDLNHFSFPYYMKANISAHKTEEGAVYRCDDIVSAKTYFKKLRKKFSDEIILQKNFEGIEMIVGIKDDKVFGKLLVVGFGGIFTEVNKDVSFRALPVSRADVMSMIKELRGYGIFSARGKKYDIEKFATFVEKVAYLGEKFDIKELDLNPVILGERDLRVVDARIEMEA